jgi:amino acid transporter
MTKPSAVVLVSSLNSVPESSVLTIGARAALAAIGCAILAPTLFVVLASYEAASAIVILAGLVAYVVLLIASLMLARRSRRLLPRGAKRHRMAIASTVMAYLCLAWPVTGIAVSLMSNGS